MHFISSPTLISRDTIILIEHYRKGIIMVNFVLREQTEPTKRSLRTHCPIMIRVHIEKEHYLEEECRCDVVKIKQDIHPGRCSSHDCPAREYLISRREKVQAVHEIIP